VSAASNVISNTFDVAAVTSAAINLKTFTPPAISLTSLAAPKPEQLHEPLISAFFPVGQV